MAAVPRFSIPSAPAGLPTTIPRFQRVPTLTPVGPDPAEDCPLARAVPAAGEILSGWIVAFALATLGFILF